MKTLLGQPIETWLHVVETAIVDPGAQTQPDRQTLLLLLHEAILLLKKDCVHEMAHKFSGACKEHRLNDCRTCEGLDVP